MSPAKCYFLCTGKDIYETEKLNFNYLRLKNNEEIKINKNKKQINKRSYINYLQKVWSKGCYLNIYPYTDLAEIAEEYFLNR